LVTVRFWSTVVFRPDFTSVKHVEIPSCRGVRIDKAQVGWHHGHDVAVRAAIQSGWRDGRDGGGGGVALMVRPEHGRAGGWATAAAATTTTTMKTRRWW